MAIFDGLNVSKRRWFWFLVVLFLYPVFVLGYVWSHCYNSGFEGGKLGQLDAYRHTLASAVVTYTLSSRAVDLLTLIESKSNKSGLMDRHNNRIGTNLGRQAARFTDIENQVFKSVKLGAENATDSNQITWLPKAQWKNSLFW